MQKWSIVFRGFDEWHTVDNIYRMIKTILGEYHLIFKFFSIGFDNTTVNTTSIPKLQEMCQSTFADFFFILSVLLMF